MKGLRPTNKPSPRALRVDCRYVSLVRVHILRIALGLQESFFGSDVGVAWLRLRALAWLPRRLLFVGMGGSSI